MHVSFLLPMHRLLLTNPRPIKAYWIYPAPDGSKCFDDGLSMQVSAVFNTFAEIWIASLPLVAVFKLRVDYRQRWSVISLLSLGYFVGMAGVVRTYFIFKLFTTFDLTWWSGPQWICSEVEIDLALVSFLRCLLLIYRAGLTLFKDLCLRRTYKTPSWPHSCPGNWQEKVAIDAGE